jgi:hypothetical protein
MLYDIHFGADGRNQPGFFEASVRQGVLHCDTRGPGPNGEAPISVRGWSSEVLASVEAKAGGTEQ